MKKILLFIVVIFLTGCVTTKPATYNFQTEKVYEAAYQKVLTKIISFSGDSRIQLKQSEKDPELIASEEVKIPYIGFLYESAYCDCGTLGGLYVYHEILGKVNVYLKNLEDDKTSVEVVARYRASKWLGNNFKEWVTCQSKGYFEESLFKYLDESLVIKPKDQNPVPLLPDIENN